MQTRAAVLTLIIAAALASPPSISQWKEDVADRYFDRLTADDLLVEKRRLLEARPPDGKAWGWLIPSALPIGAAGGGLIVAGMALAFGYSDWATPVAALGMSMCIANVLAIAFAIYKLASDAWHRDAIDEQVRRIDGRLAVLQVPSTSGPPADN